MTGEELKRIRIWLGLTQTEMAEVLLLKSVSHVCDMERGRKTVTERTAALARAADK